MHSSQFILMFWKFELLSKLKINRLSNGAFCLNLKHVKCGADLSLSNFRGPMSFSRDFFVSYTILYRVYSIP